MCSTSFFIGRWLIPAWFISISFSRRTDFKPSSPISTTATIMIPRSTSLMSNATTSFLCSSCREMSLRMPSVSGKSMTTFLDGWRLSRLAYKEIQDGHHTGVDECVRYLTTCPDKQLILETATWLLPQFPTDAIRVYLFTVHWNH